jgi:hypothetical protein
MLCALHSQVTNQEIFTRLYPYLQFLKLKHQSTEHHSWPGDCGVGQHQVIQTSSSGAVQESGALALP